MELRQLKHFVAVVEAGNLSVAASIVALSQPALTRSIKNLEDGLGVQLLERLPRGVIATPAGAAFFEHAKVLLHGLQLAKRDTVAVEAGWAGSVSVGTGTMFSNYILDSSIAAIAKSYPGLTLEIVEGLFEELVEQLAIGKLDLVFANFPHTSIGDNLLLDPMVEISSSVVVGSSHPLAGQSVVDRKGLSDARWVVVNQPHMAEFLDTFFVAVQLTAPRNSIKTNSLTLIDALVRTGQFVTVLPDHRIAAAVRSGELCRLDLGQPPIVRKVGVIRRRGAVLRPPVQYLVDSLRRACAALPAL